MAKKILVVLTSAGKRTDGHPTGWYLPELAHPYDEFIAAGYEVTIASLAGGSAPVDPSSIELYKEDSSSVSFLNDKKSLYTNTPKLSEFLGKSGDFDALFYPGGTGPMFDLATDAQSQQLIAEFADAGKLVAAVCHGPVVFTGVKLGNGEHLLAGKKVTGFSNAEEEVVGQTDKVPFLLEDKLNEVSGGKYEKASQVWASHVVVENGGKLITGQNPNSAGPIGKAIVKALGA